MKTNQPLSKLQKKILEIASRQAILGYSEVLRQFYGYVPTRYGKIMFNNAPGIKAARVAICKSFNRLVRRGMIRRVHETGVWSSITLSRG